MKPLRLINSPHPALALPNHVAYKATREEVAAMYRQTRESQQQEAAPAAAAPITAASRTVSPLPAPAVPKVLSKSEQANAAVAYSKAHSVSVVQALKTLGFAATQPASQPISPLISPSMPQGQSKEEQASAAVAHSKAHGVSVVQALKTLGYAT